MLAAKHECPLIRSVRFFGIGRAQPSLPHRFTSRAPSAMTDDPGRTACPEWAAPRPLVTPGTPTELCSYREGSGGWPCPCRPSCRSWCRRLRHADRDHRLIARIPHRQPVQPVSQVEVGIALPRPTTAHRPLRRRTGRGRLAGSIAPPPGPPQPASLPAPPEGRRRHSSASACRGPRATGRNVLPSSRGGRPLPPRLSQAVSVEEGRDTSCPRSLRRGG